MISYIKHITSQYNFKQIVVRLAEEYIWWFFRNWPGLSGFVLRYLFLKCTTKELRGFCFISQGCTLTNSYGLIIGKNFATNRNVLIDGTGGIEIGDNTGIGPNSIIFSHKHVMLTDQSVLLDQKYRKRTTRIGNNVWIASNCYIEAGVTIGDNSVIGACSCILEDVPANGRVIGVPSRPYFQVLRENKKAKT